MKTILLSLPLFLLPGFSLAADEDALNALFCRSVGGQTETRLAYHYGKRIGHVRVDCETGGTVYEGGLDKRSSLDSVQQALFFASLTGKQPAVVIYDTDGEISPYEHRIRVACQMAGVHFIRTTEEDLRQPAIINTIRPAIPVE